MRPCNEIVTNHLRGKDDCGDWMMGGKRKIRDQYDYENTFDKYVKDLDQLFVEVMMENKVGLHYATKMIRSGKRFEVEIYPIFKNKGDIPISRIKINAKAQRDLNEKNSKKKFVRLVEANFGEGDFWLTLTYDEGNDPKTEEEAKKNIRNYLTRVNRLRKKQGLGNAKYIYITEWDGGGEGPRCHYHLIIEGGIERDTLEGMWKFAIRKDSSRLYEGEEGLGGLAGYLADKKRGKWERRWNSSKNLKKPKISVSHSKTGKRQVERMVKDYEEIRGYFEKEEQWKEFRFLGAEVMYNKFNCAYYIRINARKKSWEKTKGGSMHASRPPVRVSCCNMHAAGRKDGSDSGEGRKQSGNYRGNAGMGRGNCKDGQAAKGVGKENR